MSESHILAPGDHRHFPETAFWERVPAYAGMSAEAFLDPSWQARNSIRTVGDLRHALDGQSNPEFLDDIARGVAASTMTLRVSPYIASLINWADPVHDPLRRQFLPMASEREPDHPDMTLDSLAEQANSPVPGMIRRYPDKALLLPVNTCPVYCAFCTRSYAVGLNTSNVSKAPLRANRTRWAAAFAWLRDHPEVEDVVVSGGDAYNLSPTALREIGEALLAIPSLRRIRIATKGLAVLPSRIGRDSAWTAALLNFVESGRRKMVSVALHTHFNHPNEISWVTRDAAELLFQAGVTVRNQSVLLRGVNDGADTMHQLIKRLGHLHIQPYYVYMHDMVAGTETYRTTLQAALALEKDLRGRTAGFHMPTFIVDLPGGGGKRDIHSFETYDRATGVSTFRSPAIDPKRVYRYFDPRRG